MPIVEKSDASDSANDKPQSISSDTSFDKAHSDSGAKIKPVPVKDVKCFLESSFKVSNTDHLHSLYTCQSKYCQGLSKTEHERMKSSKDRFQHHWIFDKGLSFCDETGIYWLVFEEGKGMYCILCRKNNTVNPQNKTKKFNADASVRYKRKTIEKHSSSAQHVAALEAELMSRDSIFQKQIDRRE